MILSLLAAAALTCVATPCAFVGGRVEVGDGRVLDEATVVVERGRVVALGEDVSIPAGARRVDVHGKVLTPGLIEVRARVGLSEVSAVDATNDHGMRGTLVPGFRVAEGFDPESVRIPMGRAAGVTRVLLEPSGAILCGQGAWAELSGRLDRRPDPDAPAALWGAVGEDAAAAAGGARGAVWLKLREVFEDARAYRAHRAAFDAGRSRPLVLAPLHLRALFPVLDGRLPLVLRADRASDILAAVDFARREHVRLVIAGGAEAWQVARALKAAKVPVILRPTHQRPSRFETLHAVDDGAARLHAAGVTLILSGGGWEMALDRLRQEAGIAVAYGLPRPAALAAITSVPARVFGRAGELGTLAPGARADLVVWSGDPLELATRAERVFIDGIEQDLHDRQRALAERYLSQ